MKHSIIFFLFLVPVVAGSSPVMPGPEMVAKNGYIEPFRMFDNVYYVGDRWVSSYVVTTGEGLVLIDTLEPGFGSWIPANIRKLGLNPENIRHILVTHGHSDHVGNGDYLQRLFGSRVWMTGADYQLARQLGGKSRGEKVFAAPAKVETVTDQQTLEVGNTRFIFYLTPGHTRGCMSIEFQVLDKGMPYRAFVVGGHGVNFTGVDSAEQYVASVARIRTLSSRSPVVSVNIANHPNRNQLFTRYARRNDSDNPFIDPQGFAQFIDELESAGAAKLREEYESLDSPKPGKRNLPVEI